MPNRCGQKAKIQAAGIALNLDMQLVAMEQAKQMEILGASVGVAYNEAVRRAKDELDAIG